MSIRTVFLLLALALMIVWATAQEDDSLLNPRTNPAANACYAGGSMEDRCDSDYLWVAGWYLIRVEHGMLGWDDLPQGYYWLKPQQPSLRVEETAPQAQPIGTCYNASDNSRSLRLNLGVRNGSLIYYQQPNCTGPSDPTTIVQTEAACTALGLNASIWNDGPFYNLPTGSYFMCS